MKRVIVVDYGCGNLDSVRRAFQECGADARIATAPDDLSESDGIVLPGVGVFSEAMRRLRESGFEAALQRQVADRGIPFLGICLGMQLMAGEGREGGDSPGLGWIPGVVERLQPADARERIPHVGWNEVRPEGAGRDLFGGLSGARDFYFVHSYHLRPERQADVAARTPFAGGFVSAVASGHRMGVQFHPEKSQKAGFQVIRNFLAFKG
jgi:glutamine amidotransferase